MNVGLLILALTSFIGLVAAIGYGARLEQRIRQLEEEKRRNK